MSRAFTNPVARSLYSSPARHSQHTTTPTTATTSNGPSTPIAQYPSPLPQTPLSIEQTPTGRWQHPAVTKITQLHSRRAPNETTLTRILANLAALYVVQKISPYVYDFVRLKTSFELQYIKWTFMAVYLLFVYNVFDNARRFWWVNTYDDPSLSASQRKLLNLPASPISAGASGTAAAVTPPRYQKTFTPSPASQSSPLSGRRSSYGAVSPSNRLGEPLRSQSPTTRSVSMLASTGSGLGSGGSLSSVRQGSPGPTTRDFAGSTRWKYAQSHDSPNSSFSFL